MKKYYYKPTQKPWYHEHIDFLSFIVIMLGIYIGILITLWVTKPKYQPVLPVTDDISTPASRVPTTSIPDPCTLNDVVCGSEQYLHKLQGEASWYDYSFEGDSTRLCFRSREDCYTMYHAVTAARDFPRGTRLLVTNVDTKASVEVVVTDYGPEADKHPDRIVDLSSFAFSKIAPLHAGHARVTVQPL